MDAAVQSRAATFARVARHRASPRPSFRRRACTGPRAQLADETQKHRGGSYTFIPAADNGDAATWDEASNRLRYRKPDGVTRVIAPPGAPPIVILPGFGNDTGDYVAPFGNADASLAASLRARGWDVHVVQLERKDWANILRAVFSRGFWTGKSTTDPGYTWYLQRVDDAVRRALAANEGAASVDFVAHSAGGWLARAYIGGALNDVDWSKRKPGERRVARIQTPHPAVRRLVSLGSPHRAPPKGANDATRGAIGWVDDRWPGAHYQANGVRYACVTGRTVRGKAGPDAKGTLAGYSCNSYVQVCGQGDEVEGDAVVPNDFAMLDGADNLVIDGVFHSMSKVGTYDTAAKDVWYGSEEVIDLWLGSLL